MKALMMEKQSCGMELVKKPVRRAVSGQREVREATTGRVVGTVPRLWAVGCETVKRETAARDHRSSATPAAGAEVELAFYRKYTRGMLRRYAQMSMESGRVPSLLGKEMFRGRVTSYRVHGFDDVVIFCCDMEKCLKRLHETERQMIKRIALQEYTQGEAASMFGISLRQCVLQYGQALDRLTKILLEVRMLEPLKSCQ